MLNPLFAYIEARSHTPLSDEDKSVLREALVYRRYKKKQFLLQEGDICKSLSCILKGATRQYLVDNKGNEQRRQVQQVYRQQRQNMMTN